MITISGIYKIQSIRRPHRFYIGSAINTQNRWWIHLHLLRKNKHHSKKLQRHYNKYGESDLVFTVLTGCDKEDLIKQEQYFIDSYNPYFNCSPSAGSPLGRVVSEETKMKLRVINQGKRYSDEVRKRLSDKMKTIIPKHDWNRGKPAWNKGKKCSEETKLKMLPKLRENAKKRIGIKIAPEVVKKRIETKIRNGTLRPSLETRKKMSKPIIQLNKGGNILKEFWGASEAGEVLSINPNRINRVCTGVRKSYQGYYFKYK